MNLLDFKAKYCFEKVQAVIFNRNGQLLDSCDTLISLSNFSSQNLFDVFPVLEGVKGILADMQAQVSKPLLLSRVEFPFAAKYLICDFTFSAILYQGEAAYLWIIQDLTEQYNYLFVVQQERNETVIEAQQLRAENEILSLRKDIALLNKLREVRSDVNNSIISEIEAPLNRIMALTSKLKETTQTRKEYSYLESMESAITIIDDQLTQSRPVQLDLFLVPPDRSETDLQNLIWNVLKIFEYDNWVKESPFYLNFKPDLPKNVWVNKPRVAQLFHNFIAPIVFDWKGLGTSLSASVLDMKSTHCRLEFIITCTLPTLSNSEIENLSEKTTRDIDELARSFKGIFDLFLLPDNSRVVMTLQLPFRLNISNTTDLQ